MHKHYPFGKWQHNHAQRTKQHAHKYTDIYISIIMYAHKYHIILGIVFSSFSFLTGRGRRGREVQCENCGCECKLCSKPFGQVACKCTEGVKDVRVSAS